MINRIRQTWQRWQQRRRKKTAARYLQKRSLILAEGLSIPADVVGCYPARIREGQMALLRLRLSIPLKNRVAADVLSSTFTAVPPQTLKGKRLRIRFLPGDLSHVVILA